MLKYALALLALIAIPSLHANGSGSGLCTDDVAAMSSGMGGTNNPSLGWSLLPSSLTYQPGKPLTIFLTSRARGQAFSGLLLFARSQTRGNVGRWYSLPQGYQTLDLQCSRFGTPGSTLSHNSDGQKAANQFTWLAPPKGTGQVEFRGLIVTQGMTQWMQFKPLIINESGAPTIPSLATVRPPIVTAGGAPVNLAGTSPIATNPLTARRPTTAAVFAPRAPGRPLPVAVGKMGNKTEAPPPPGPASAPSSSALIGVDPASGASQKVAATLLGAIASLAVLAL